MASGEPGLANWDREREAYGKKQRKRFVDETHHPRFSESLFGF